MNLPSGFGEFFPDGDFEGELESGSDGWRQRLLEYYEAQTPGEKQRLYSVGETEGMPSYALYVSEKFIREIGTRSGDGTPPYGPIEPHEPPHFFQTEKNYAVLGSLIMLNDRIVAVDNTLKTIIERLDPGAHQFFPIEIRMPNGAAYPQAYHTVAIRYVDSFSPEKSKPGSFRTYPDYPDYYTLIKSKQGVTGITLKNANFGGAHFWRERALHEWLICLSDELKTEIDRANLRLPNHYRMKEV